MSARLQWNLFGSPVRAVAVVTGVGIAALVAVGLPARAQQRAATTVSAVEWRYYGSDAGSTKYSPLDQINRDNVKNLRIAWRWKVDNFGPAPEFNLEATPLAVNGVLYTTAGTRRDIVAIDGATGETPHHRQTCLADRGAAGAAVRCARREDVADAAVSDQTGAVRSPGRLAGRSD